MNNNDYENENNINNKQNNKKGNSILFVIGSLVIALCIYLFLLFGLVVYNQAATKPIIYLYPKQETEVSVKLEGKDRITCSYPKYINGWRVIAKPNGDLKDLDTGKNLYSLYYESDNKDYYKLQKEGFVVKGEDVAKFLEEKLEILGLNEREAEEFIIYWLPRLEKNKYNYIRFATEEEINKNMPLEITPKPETTIRVMMTYKGLNKPIKVEEQKLVSPERKGFIAVEWGGSEIK